MLANHPTVLGRAPTASSLQIGNVDGPNPAVSTDNALARWDGTSGRAIQNGVVTEADYTGTITGASDQATTTAVGSAFANQPANDTVTIVSASSSDVQTATIIGTTNGGNTTVIEAIVLTGTTPVVSVKSNWGVILAVKLSSAAVGTITLTKTTGALTITTLSAAATSKGVNTVTNTAAFNRAVSVVASGATTKQIGFGGTNTSGTQIYDSVPLTGTTAATSNSSFNTITEIYSGDVEATRTVTLTTNGGWVLTGGGGGTLTFNTLGTSLAASGAFLVGNGTAAAPSYSFSNSSTSGFYRSAADQIGVSLAGAKYFTFDAGGVLTGAGGGLLQLDAGGAVKLTASGTNQSITLTPSGSGLWDMESSATALGSNIATWFSSGQVANASWTNGHYVLFGKNSSSKNAGVLQFAYVGNGSSSNAFGLGVNGIPNSIWLPASGNVLLGGLTTDGTGVLQFPAATTSAGGITFGTDVNFFRGAAGQLWLNSTGTNPALFFAEGGTSKAFVATNSGVMQIGTNGATNTQFYTNNTLALTLDSSQNATFAGFVRGNGGFKGSAGGVGLTQASTTTLGKSITVENGLITAFA